MTTELLPILDIAALRALEARHAGRAADGARRRWPPPRRREGWPASAAAGSSCSPVPATTAAMRSSLPAWLRGGFHDVLVVFPGDPAAPAARCRGRVSRLRRRRRNHGGRRRRHSGRRWSSTACSASASSGRVEGAYAGAGRLGQRRRRADARARRADRPRRGNRQGARADDPRDGDGDVHRVQAGPADRRTVPITAATISVHSLGIDAGRGARGHRLDWPALAAALPPVLAARARATSTRARSARWASSAEPKAWAAR